MIDAAHAPHADASRRGELRVDGISRRYGATIALDGVHLTVRPGEVHALIGENGAGKSTLIRILAGVYDDWAGAVTVQGRALRLAHPRDAVRAGIATIHQELSLIPSMSVADNLFLGRERRGRLGGVRFEEQEVEAARLLAAMGLEFSPRQAVAELPLASRQLLEIARALARDASLLIFDEPTSALGEHEVEPLFARILELKQRGRGVVYITHRMEEIYRLADRITVLRDGRVVGGGAAAPAELPPEELVRRMVGRDRVGGRAVGAAARRERPAEPALVVEALRVEHPELADRPVVADVSFTLGRGEIVGLAGLQGSGASEVLHALFGALGRRVSGRAALGGEPLPLRSPRDSVARGLTLLTSDRKATGLAPDLSVTHNVSLASLPRLSNRAGWVLRRREQEAVAGLAGDFGLDAPSLAAPMRTLSGGNQQKAYLARCLLPGPRVLLLDEPTRGIDVGAKADIYELMSAWVGRGISILLITSEMEELLALSDRVLVMHRGRLVAELSGTGATRERVLAAAMGHAA
jgi:ABC-type sugar transport system ATPase subunit